MANLIAKLGLDSAEFKAGLADAKAATGGFQNRMKDATTSMRNMFQVVMGPIALVTAAVMLVRKGFAMLDDVAKAAGDSMRAAVLGDVETSIDRLKTKVDDLRGAYKQLADEQSVVSGGIEKRAKLAEDIAAAEMKLAGATAEAEKRAESERKSAQLQRESDAKKQSSALKAQRGFDAKDQAKKAREEYDIAMSQAGKLRADARTGGLQYEGYASEFGKNLTGVITQKLPGEENAQASVRVAGEIEKKARESLKMAEALEAESRAMERESLVDMEAASNAEKRIGLEKLNEQARQAEERKKILEEDFQMRLDIYRRNKELEEREASDKQAAAQRQAERIGAIRGRGLDAGSMARIGGFLGGERPGLAVADRQLQVSKEMLDIAKDTRTEQRKQTGYLERLTGGQPTGAVL